jgi:hypothetical protein
MPLASALSGVCIAELLYKRGSAIMLREGTARFLRLKLGNLGRHARS